MKSLNNLSIKFIYLQILLLGCAGSCGKAEKDSKEKPRIIVTCDPELDDQNSLIRFLLYSTDFRVEGLVYASSQFHWKGDGKGTKWFVPGREYTRFGLNMGPMESWRWAKDEHFIHDAVDIYEKVYPNLKIHNADYPDPEYLKSVIRYGNIEFDGDMSKDSPGSDLIKSVILDEVPGTLFITAWGGQSTIARALKSIQDQYETEPGWKDLVKKISGKVVLCQSGDQDDTYAKYIKPNWPGIVTQQVSGGTVGLAYMAQAAAPREDSSYYSPAWIKENISSKGPFGEFYRVSGDSKQMVKGDIFDYFGLAGDYSAEELKKMGYIVWSPIYEKGSFLGEGDTFTYLNLLDNGLKAYEDQTWGGWSGRKRENEGIARDSLSTFMFMRRDSVMPDFLPAAQNGLATRFNWSVTPDFKDANHEPVIESPSNITASAGKTINLKGTVTDPDGDDIAVKWWQFRVGTYKGKIEIDNPDSAAASVKVPEDAKTGETIHVILEATDNGSPRLTHYHRTIITVK